jgi:hypothetical protein
MSRLSYFGIGAGMVLMGVGWCFVGELLWVGLAIGRESVPGASTSDSAFITFYVVWGGGLLGILWGAFSSFRRSLRPPPRVARPPSPPPTDQPHGLAVGATADERLAPLLKKPKDDGVVQ